MHGYHQILSILDLQSSQVGYTVAATWGPLINAVTYVHATAKLEACSANNHAGWDGIGLYICAYVTVTNWDWEYGFVLHNKVRAG